MELLPCPFCGGKPYYATACGEDWLQCERCGCMTEMRSSQVNLPAIWNARAPDARVQLLAKALQAALPSLRADAEASHFTDGFNRKPDTLQDEILQQALDALAEAGLQEKVG